VRVQLAFLLIAVAACKDRPQATKTVPFEDNFDRSELGPDWLPSGGQWMIDKNAVYTTGANNAPLFLKVDLPDDVAVEVDIMSETPLVDAKIELMTDGRTHQSGYIFILGGWSNKISVIARRDEHGADRKEKSPTDVTGNKWYRWRIEKKGGELTWYLDGKVYMTFSDPAPIHGPGNNRLAFSNWQNQIRYDNLRVWALKDAPPVQSTVASTSTKAE
jgi:hypothetical protein